MSPLATLFVAALALYFIECVIVVPDEALVLVEARRGRWRIARIGFALGAMARRLVLLPPYAPHAAALVLPAWKGALAPGGFLWRDGQTERVVSYDEVRDIGAADSSIRWGSRRLSLDSPRRASWLADALASVCNAPKGARAPVLDATLVALTDGERVRARVAELRRASRWTRRFGLALFAHLFFIWPATVAWLGIRLIWPVLLGELVLLVTLVCWSYVRARRTLEGPQGPRDPALLLTLMLSPPAAARASAVLARDLLGDVHPVVVALHLCDPRDASTLAAQARREARFGTANVEMPGTRAVDARAIEDWFNARWRERLDQSIAATIGLSSVPGAPPRDGASAAYCPRCWTQYARATGACGECDGVALSAFDAAS